MSIYIRFFNAPNDADAAQVLDDEPGSVSETRMRDRFLASSALAEWETILTGRSPEGDAQLRIVADDRPRSSSKIFAAPPGLRAALVAADLAGITEAARQWVDQYGDRYGNPTPDRAGEILYELSGLVRMADAEHESVYLWMRLGGKPGASLLPSRTTQWPLPPRPPAGS